MLRKGGTAVLIGIPKMRSELTVPNVPFVLNETRIIGTLMGAVPFQIFIPQLAEHYLNGMLNGLSPDVPPPMDRAGGPVTLSRICIQPE